jgi:5-methylcytosine-specific restriction endonuclease McrA
VDTKLCRKCNETKPLAEFHMNRSKPDGRQPFCKPCWMAYSKASRERHLEARRATARETARRYKAEHREQVQEKNRAWYAANGAAYARKWRSELNPEAARAASQRSHERHREQERTAAQRYRSRLLGLTEHHTDAEWLALCAEYGQRCAACGEQRPLERDHIVPLVNGGSNTIDNLQPLCGPCNKKKWLRETDYRKPKP